MAEPENVVLHLLREMREDMREMRAEMATKDGLGELRSEVKSLRADVASDLLNLEKRMSDQEKRMNDQFVALRRSVMEYHSTAVGHGILYSELEERVRRIEQRLEMSPPEPH
jgi:hypothetical protein